MGILKCNKQKLSVPFRFLACHKGNLDKTDVLGYMFESLLVQFYLLCQEKIRNCKPIFTLSMLCFCFVVLFAYFSQNISS